jgi:hypothetical protein
MAMLLNLASGLVPPDATVKEPDATAEEAEALAWEVDAILSDPAREFHDCVLAQHIADEFNNGHSLPAADNCDQEGAPPPVGNSLRVRKHVPNAIWLTWRNLPPGQARKHAVMQLLSMADLPPSRSNMDDLADWLLETTEGPAGVQIEMPGNRLVFWKVRGLSPSWEIPGSTRVR